MTLRAITPASGSSFDAQTQIDKELAELEQTLCELQAQICSINIRMCSLRAQRNSTVLACRLPSEVLSSIFVHWARMNHYHESSIDETAYGTEYFSDQTTDDSESLSDDTRSTMAWTESMSEAVGEQMHGVPEWINVSYVCHHWREAALDCPTLWSYISPASQPWIREMLIRSKPAQLRVRLDWTPMRSNELVILEELLAHTERIEELRLDFPPDDVEIVFPMFSSPAPLLRSLEVFMMGRREPPNESSLIPLFDGVTPALQQLQLHGCFIQAPRSPSKFYSLTTLILSDLYPPIEPTSTELHVMLASMPNLVHLELDHALAKSPSEVTQNSQNYIQLPHLLRLAVLEPFSRLVHFLLYLEISPSCEVRIYNTSYDHHDEWMSFRSLLRQRFFTSNFPPSRALTVDAATTINLTFSASENDKPDYLGSWPWYWGCNIPLKIRFSKRNSQELVNIIQDAHLNGFLEGLQSTRVTLGAAIHKNECSSSFEDLFSVLPALRYIEVIDARKSLGCLCSFLSLTPHQRDQTTSDPQISAVPFAPTLEELVLRDCKFDRSSSNHDQHDGSVASLHKALATRKENGLAPIRLVLIECRRLLKKEVGKLKGMAAQVIWDGIEGDSEYRPDTSGSEGENGAGGNEASGDSENSESEE